MTYRREQTEETDRESTMYTTYCPTKVLRTAEQMIANI
jgi:hypothetical protein